MKKSNRSPSTRRLAETLYERLLDAYGPQECCLTHRTPFELLVATILSAQCTDRKVNRVTPGLFERFPDASAFAEASPEELEKWVHPCGFYRAKSRHIQSAARAILEQFGGEVPGTLDELVTLPGVGRKTANVVLGDAFSVPGLPVDTHVKRLANKIGLVDTDDPDKIEKQLCGLLNPEQWSQFSHLLIAHGRARCPARRPDCRNCEIRDLCAEPRKTTANATPRMPCPQKQNRSRIS